MEIEKARFFIGLEPDSHEPIMFDGADFTTHGLIVENPTPWGQSHIDQHQASNGDAAEHSMADDLILPSSGGIRQGHRGIVRRRQMRLG